MKLLIGLVVVVAVLGLGALGLVQYGKGRVLASASSRTSGCESRTCVFREFWWRDEGGRNGGITYFAFFYAVAGPGPHAPREFYSWSPISGVIQLSMDDDPSGLRDRVEMPVVSGWASPTIGCGDQPQVRGWSTNRLPLRPARRT